VIGSAASLFCRTGVRSVALTGAADAPRVSAALTVTAELFSRAGNDRSSPNSLDVSKADLCVATELIWLADGDHRLKLLAGVRGRAEPDDLNTMDPAASACPDRITGQAKR
jgi:hypothetical protein